MRSTRKQLQGIMHHVMGNFQMRVNSSSPLPATYFLPICAFVGQGKSIYFRFLKELMNLLYEGVMELDQQVFNAQNPLEEHGEEEEKKGKKREKPKFKPRQLLHGPGTREGWESALSGDKRVIQICEEGDLW